MSVDLMGVAWLGLRAVGRSVVLVVFYPEQICHVASTMYDHLHTLANKHDKLSQIYLPASYIVSDTISGFFFILFMTVYPIFPVCEPPAGPTSQTLFPQHLGVWSVRVMRASEMASYPH